MEVKCKKQINDTVGDTLFLKYEMYKLLYENDRQICLKDELGCFRWFNISGSDSKFFKEHFEIVKEKKNK